MTNPIVKCIRGERPEQPKTKIINYPLGIPRIGKYYEVLGCTLDGNLFIKGLPCYFIDGTTQIPIPWNVNRFELQII